MQDNYDHKKFDKLRRQAEETVKANFRDIPESLESLSPEESQRLLHQLQVYQVELEMQNEELRRAQLELEASRTLYFDLYNLAPFGYLILDEWSLIRDANLTFARMVGTERSELAGEPFTRFIDKADQDYYYLSRKQLWQTKNQEACELRLVKKDASCFWVRLEMTMVSDHNKGAPVCRAVIMDVTKLKQAEEVQKTAQTELEYRVCERTSELEKTNEKLQDQIAQRNITERALQNSEEHFRKIVDLMPIAIFGHTEKSIIFANTAATELLRAEDTQDFLGKALVEFLHPDNLVQFEQLLKSVLLERIEKKTFSSKFVSMAGEDIDVELSLMPFTHQNVPAVQITAYNISERKQIEEEIIKAEKLESISILAGGIAHDFNNILTIILGHLSVARQRSSEKNEAIHSHLKEIEKATRQAIGLTKQLLTFAKGGTPVKSAALIEELIEETVMFALSGSNVSCHFQFADDLMPVEVDRGQISQVLNNLIINAVQAMPGGGTIFISVENTTVHKKNNLPLQEGNYIKISVRDEGEGIPEEVRRNIFSPFFSTKSTGTGLGLTTSYSIIKQHDGYITVDSQMGVGATFIIYLPASSGVSVNWLNVNQEIKTGRGRVLVMDDEEAILRLTGEMLPLLGYDTEFACDGLEAIALYTRAFASRKPFDAVILDLTVRGAMGGKDAVKKLLEIDPGVRAIVSSGYSNDAVLSNFSAYGFKGMVSKPYQLEELGGVLHQVISQER